MFNEPKECIYWAIGCLIVSIILFVFQFDTHLYMDFGVLGITMSCIANVWKAINKRFDNIEKKLKN